MKTNKFSANVAGKVLALAAVVMMSSGFAACSGDDPPPTPEPIANTVRIDGVEKLVQSTLYAKPYTSNPSDFELTLYLSEDKKEYISIEADKSKHLNKDIDLTKIDPATYYLEIVYEIKNKKLFDAYLSNDNGLTFTTGTLRMDGDPEGEFTINLKDGKITDVDYGDGKEHTVSINWRGKATKK